MEGDLENETSSSCFFSMFGVLLQGSEGLEERRVGLDVEQKNFQARYRSTPSPTLQIYFLPC